ncbi:MAG: helix-turn-helix transcriptional regulator [Actinomycetota bacterium]
MVSPQGLSTHLRQARVRAGLTGRALAAQLGWGEYKVSKIENGRQMPTHEEIMAWADKCGVDADGLFKLEELQMQALAQHFAWANRANTPAVQHDYTNLAKETIDTFGFEADLIPGHLQIVGYARRVCTELMERSGDTTEPEIEDAISQRMERAALIYDTSRNYRFLVGEAALRYWYVEPDVMRAQLAHVAVVADLPNVQIGVVPFGVELPVILLNSFTIFDGLVAVETRTTEARYHPDSDEAIVYRNAAEDLWNQAVVGPDAIKLIQQVVAELPQGEQIPLDWGES